MTAIPAPPNDLAALAAARVAAIAAQYDNEDGDLTRAALGRLARLQAVAGKTCSKCGEKKALSEFGRDARTTTGLQYACRACDRERKPTLG